MMSATATVFSITRADVEDIAGREVSDDEARLIGQAIRNSTVWDCVVAAVEQVNAATVASRSVARRLERS